MMETDLTSNLPKPRTVSGALPQAAARKAAPRGGTPNAPEQPNDTTPTAGAGTEGSALVNPQTSPGLVDRALSALSTVNRGIGVANAVTNPVTTLGGMALGKGLELATAPAADALKSTVYGAVGYQPANPTQYTDAAANSLVGPAGAIQKGVVAPVRAAIAAQPDAVAKPAVPPGAPPSATPPVVQPQVPATVASVQQPADDSVSVPVPRANPLAAMPQAPVVDPIAIANNAARAKIDAMNARDNANYQAATNSMIAQVNRADAAGRLDKAEQNARHANFRAQNGADMILRGGNAATRAGLLERQRQANQDVDLATGAMVRASEGTMTNRDFVGEESRLSKIGLDADANARAARAEPGQNALVAGQVRGQDLAAQIQQLAIDGTKAQQSLVAKIRAEKDPAKQRQLVTTLLASQGKEKPDSYKAVHAKGGSDPNNPLATLPDQVFVINEADGTVRQANAPAATGAKVPSLDEFMKAAKADPRNKAFDDAYLKNKYAALYPGAK